MPWLVIKGPVLAELSYRDVTRGYWDLDLMVPAPRFRAAVSALEAVGAAVTDKNWPLLEQAGAGEISMAVEDLPGIDLHWPLVNQRRARQMFMFPMDEVLERRRRVDLGATPAWAPEPSDFLVHLALHASLSGANRLGWLLDIERTVARQPPDWDAVVERSRGWRVGLPVSAALNRACQTLGAPVPEDVVGALAGGWAERLLAHQLGHWAPSGRLPGGRSLSNGVVRALRGCSESLRS